LVNLIASLVKRWLLALPLTEVDPAILMGSDPFARMGVRSVPFPSRRIPGRRFRGECGGPGLVDLLI
jgi:hypothetical protein